MTQNKMFQPGTMAD